MDKQKITLIADPMVLDIPIEENQEPLFNLRNQSDLLIGPSPEIENNQSYTFVRSSIFEKLIIAQKSLPSHLRLCLYEGLRTLSLQKELFDARWSKIKNIHANWTDPEIYYEVIKMVSPVHTLKGELNVPPHSTGAAVDVYLVDATTHEAVDMGILAKDWLQDPEGVLSITESTLISSEAKMNRTILSKAMSSAGFANYPTEYWHWSYGDRYWAFVKKKPYAYFGPVTELKITP